MDIIAHGLWTYVAGHKNKNRANWYRLIFFGILPDLIWIPFTVVNLFITRQIHYFWPPYNVGHSLAIWLVVTLVIMIRWRNAFKFTWPWALHILIDIPGHLDMFTPILWPISNWKISGQWDWLTWPWLAGTYVILVAIIFCLYRKKIRKKPLGSG
jgi:hypothetical protein